MRAITLRNQYVEKGLRAFELPLRIAGLLDCAGLHATNAQCDQLSDWLVCELPLSDERLGARLTQLITVS